MESAVWGIVGIIVGGLLTMLGNLLLHVTERGARRREEEAATRTRARDERKSSYLRLLTSARKLRYIAREPARADPEVVDSLRTDLSTIQYEIELIAPIRIVQSANTLRRATLDYLNAALEAGDPSHVEHCRRSSRAAVGNLVAAARTDLGIASDDWDQVPLPDAPNASG